MSAKSDAMAENAGFVAFCEKYGDDAGIEVMDRIADASWSPKSQPTVVFSDVHQHNACNHTYSGKITYAGEEFGFIVESGDRNGTVIHAWGDPEDIVAFEPPKPVTYTFVPRDPNLKNRNPGLYGVYVYWTSQQWFKEKVRAYNYDRHFQPGSTIEEYYRDWAAQRGMVIKAEYPED